MLEVLYTTVQGGKTGFLWLDLELYSYVAFEYL